MLMKTEKVLDQSDSKSIFVQLQFAMDHNEMFQKAIWYDGNMVSVKYSTSQSIQLHFQGLLLLWNFSE